MERDVPVSEFEIIEEIKKKPDTIVQLVMHHSNKSQKYILKSFL
jgi:hypothetical protein